LPWHCPPRRTPTPTPSMVDASQRAAAMQGAWLVGPGRRASLSFVFSHTLTSPPPLSRRRDRAGIDGPPGRGPARLARSCGWGWDRYVWESAGRAMCACLALLCASCLSLLSSLSRRADSSSSPPQASASPARPLTSTSSRSARASGPRSRPRASRRPRGRRTRRRQWATWWSFRYKK